MNSYEPGGRIHSTDPFAVPESDKSEIRRLRGRLAAPVTLWTTPGTPGASGLTVSSIVVADGDPGRIVGLIDEESDFWDAAEQSGRFAVTPLTPADRQLADRFAGLMPSPGGLFALGEWRQTDYGPVPAHAGTWAGCRLDGSRPCGWSLLVEGVIETVTAAGGEAPLLHYRGRYADLGPTA
ncbi:flavin reductase family protein [Actinoplanes rectilineatus]|uniref:flavin reductase family protein n=1 Tax=Actinoplanes rectilineatus TaxID=113571 RepID=UPI0005F2A112|nr:flavin reductase family protein [Actinoplanes rectilineatus]